MKKKHFHYLKDAPVDARSRAARFEKPIVAVKHVKQPPDSSKKDYSLIHVSMQSTGSTNISTVNALQEVGHYVTQRQKGQGDTKRIWGIEMNEGRQTYLKLYCAVDKIDQALKEWMVNYITWRWWHAPVRHGKAIGLSMAHQLYLQCAQGGVDPSWKVDKPMSAPAYRRKLSRQLCEYRARNRQYPGDEIMREATQQHKRRRMTKAHERRLLEALETCDDGTKRVSYNQYLDAKRPRARTQRTRLCSDNLELLKEHIQSFNLSGTRAKCQMCGEFTVAICGKCGLNCCFKDGGRYQSTGLSCSLDLHNDDYFGLSLNDHTKLLGKPRGSFKRATKSDIKANSAHIQKLRKQYFVDMINKDDD